jgi:hypothetical protein
MMSRLGGAARGQVRTSLDTAVRSLAAVVCSNPPQDREAAGVSEIAGLFSEKVARLCKKILGLDTAGATKETLAQAVSGAMCASSLLTGRHDWSLDARETTTLAKRLGRGALASRLEAIRELANRDEWSDVYYVALRTLREAGLA